MSGRSTHSDLAQLLNGLGERLALIPPGYMVSDGPSLGLVRAAAEALIEQDRRIDTFTVGLSEMDTPEARQLIVKAQR